MLTYDVIVIGTGAANTVTEIASDKGKRVAVVEMGKFGGTCLTRGCIPTKVMVTAADAVREAELWSEIGVVGNVPTLDWKVITKRLWQKIDESEDLQSYYENKEGVDVFLGKGHFIGAKVIQVDGHNGKITLLTAPIIILGVGARTNVKYFSGLQNVDFMTSESFFGEKYPSDLPQSITILGGGPIGVEFAHALSAGGVKVNLVQRNKQLLPKEEVCISDALAKKICAFGIDLYVNHIAVAVESQMGTICLTIEERNTGIRQVIKSEMLLFATGIQPNTDGLGLEHTDIQLNDSGYIMTNEFLETSEPGVYALGDVNGKPPFRHKANYEADIIAHNLFEEKDEQNWRWARYDVVPAVTYSYPQVAHVGLTEAQAKEKGYKIKTAIHYFSQTAKGFAMGLIKGSTHDGFIKLIGDAETDCLLGAHIIGPQASILLQPFIQLLNVGETKLIPIHGEFGSSVVQNLRTARMVREMNPKSIITIGETMTPHPSLSEAVMWTRYYYEGKK